MLITSRHQERMLGRQFLSQHAALLVIAIFCLLAHWQLLLNDGFYWDDNLLYELFANNNYRELDVWTLEMGLPLNTIFSRIYGTFGYENHRLLSFLILLSSAWVLYKLYQYYAPNGYKRHGVWFSLLFVSVYPFRSTVLFSTTNYQLMVLLFLLAVLIRTINLPAEKNYWRPFQLLTFALLSFLSFNLASILVIYYLYLLFDHVHENQYSRGAWRLKTIRGYLGRNMFLVLLPVFYWVWKNNWFPVHGFYSSYNKLNFDFEKSFGSIEAFFSVLFSEGSLTRLASEFENYPFWALVVFGIILFGYGRTMRIGLDEQSEPISRTYPLVFCVLLFIFSALPYALVSQHPRFQGWESRHLIIFTVSYPIIIFIFSILFVDWLRAKCSAKNMEFILRAIFSFLIINAIIVSNLVYRDYQLVAIKHLAIVESLRKMPELKACSSFSINDEVGDFSRRDPTWFEANHDAWYAWTAIFTRAWGNQRWFGNNHDERFEYVRHERYGSTEINPYGDRCPLVIEKVTKRGKNHTLVKYWRLRLTGTEEQVRDYLKTLIRISRTDLKNL